MLRIDFEATNDYESFKITCSNDNTTSLILFSNLFFKNNLYIHLLLKYNAFWELPNFVKTFIILLH